MKNAEHVLVAINEEGEHEIIFVSNDIKEVNHRAMSYADECFVYSCGVKAYNEALHTMNDVPSPSRQVETLVRQCATISQLCDIEIAEYTNETGEYPKCLHMPKSYLDKLKTEVAPYCETKVDEIDKYAGCEIYTDEIRKRVRASA